MQSKKHSAEPRSQQPGTNRRIIQKSGPPKRVYQVWKGRNRFFLGGRLVFGPDVKSLAITISLIVVPVILFTVFVSQKLVHDFSNNVGDLIVAMPIVLAAYDILLLFLTSGRDPGIIPRNAHPPEPEDDGEASTLSADWSGSHGAPTLPLTKDVIVNGVVVKVKYCPTCMLYRPPRCSHCSICNNCVERFDHHCPWVGQCIGKRNYRYFFMFVSTTAVLCLYVFVFCWVHTKKIMDSYHCNLWRAVVRSPISGVLIIFTFIGTWFVGGLTAFHFYLICTNQTTYENFKYRYDGKMNPYNRGCFRNVWEIFFSRIPKSKNDFRAKVKEDLPPFSSSLSRGRALSQNTSKASFDLEMGAKRQAVAAEEFEDIQSQIESVGGGERCSWVESVGGGERCSTQLPRSSWGSRKGSWDITPDLESLAVEFGMGHGYTDREKIQRIM